MHPRPFFVQVNRSDGPFTDRPCFFCANEINVQMVGMRSSLAMTITYPALLNVPFCFQCMEAIVDIIEQIRRQKDDILPADGS
jgi:hypothetical protein